MCSPSLNRGWFLTVPIFLIFSFPRLSNAEERPLQPEMNELHTVLMNLNTDLSRPLPYPGSSEHQKIEVRMERLSRLAHRVTGKTLSNGTGQLYPILGEALPEQADQMTSAWRLGQTAYSKALFRTLSSTCIECHAAGGPHSVPQKRLNDPDLALWNPVDRGRYLRSVGFLELAFEAFKQAIEMYGSDARAGSASSWNLEEALYELLSLEIRTSGKPDRLIGILKPWGNREDLPKYLRSDLSGWVRDLDAWAREPVPQGRVHASQLLSRAKQHIRKAGRLQESPTDRSSLVWYWRAVAELYRVLKLNLRPEQRGDAYFLLGTAFEVLTPRYQETLHERFYESCIREVPHTPRSDLCYRKLERSIVAGYTGSSGTRIPEEVRKRLLELWGTAFLKKGLELR